MTSRACVVGALLLLAVSITAGEVKAATAGLHIKVSETAGQASPDIERAKVAMQVLLQERLEKLSGLAIEVALPESDEMRTPAKEEEWVRRAGLDFYVRVEFTPSLGSAWLLQWELYDLRKNRDKPRAQWPRPRKGGSTIMLSGDGALAIVETRVRDIRDAFARLAGVRTRHVVLISCFKGVPSRSEDQDNLNALTIFLPSGLHGELQRGWENRYEARVLGPTHIDTCCVRSQDTAWLNAEKDKADYVIEGHIMLSTSGRTTVTIHIRTKHGTSSSESFETKGFDPFVVRDGVATFLQSRWAAIEKKLQ